MYPRKYSLKTRYNFNKVLNRGDTFITSNLLLKYLKVEPEVFNEEADKAVDKKFAIIASNKFVKSAVQQNRVKRVISEAVRLRLDMFPANYYYIFIPKKTCLKGGKVDIHVQDIGTQIDSFLSKVAIV